MGLVLYWLRALAPAGQRTRTVATTQRAAFLCSQEFFEQEAQLALQDRIQRETADSKNALESYVYSLRSKLSDSLSSYTAPATRDALIERLNDMEVCIASEIVGLMYSAMVMLYHHIAIACWHTPKPVPSSVSFSVVDRYVSTC
jgi:hypothetical protein